MCVCVCVNSIHLHNWLKCWRIYWLHARGHSLAPERHAWPGQRDLEEPVRWNETYGPVFIVLGMAYALRVVMEEVMPWCACLDVKREREGRWSVCVCVCVRACVRACVRVRE